MSYRIICHFWTHNGRTPRCYIFYSPHANAQKTKIDKLSRAYRNGNRALSAQTSPPPGTDVNSIPFIFRQEPTPGPAWSLADLNILPSEAIEPGDSTTVSDEDVGIIVHSLARLQDLGPDERVNNQRRRGLGQHPHHKRLHEAELPSR